MWPDRKSRDDVVGTTEGDVQELVELTTLDLTVGGRVSGMSDPASAPVAAHPARRQPLGCPSGTDASGALPEGLRRVGISCSCVQVAGYYAGSDLDVARN